MYDEPMYHNNSPVVSFTPIFQAPLNVSLLSESWVTSQSYELNYQLLNFPLQSTIFDFHAVLATDLAGNHQIAIDIDDFVEIIPALGIMELANESILIYPSILNSGQSLKLRSEFILADEELGFELYNGFGQEVQRVIFESVNGHYVSNEIDVTPGIYYLRNASYSVKIIII
jgi:hypothetical protein